MMNIWPIPVFSDNYVWVLQHQSHPGVVIVDPGQAQPVVRALSERSLEISAILLTHHHRDHIGGVEELSKSTSITVFGPQEIPSGLATSRIEGSQTLDLPGVGLDLEVIDVPGHTANHVAYVGDGFAFVGDTLFAGGCGRLFEGTAEQMLNSLQRLANLDPNTKIYCAHEYTVANLEFALAVEPDNPHLRARFDAECETREHNRPTIPSTLELELRTNPFLRCERPEVVAAAIRWSGHDLDPGVPTFAAIRSWKDGF